MKRFSAFVLIVCFGCAAAPPKPDFAAASARNGYWIRARFVATSDGVLRNKYILIRSERIRTIADALPSDVDPSLVISGENSILSPELINSHDHIGYNHAGPCRESLPGNVSDHPDRYSHRNDWRKGCRGYPKIDAPSDKTPDTVIWNEIRQITAGTTSVISSGGTKGFLRNSGSTPDLCEELEGVKDVIYDTFPLGDDYSEPPASGDGYPKHPDRNSFAGKIYVTHVAEGVDDTARNEFINLSSNQGKRVDILGPNVGLIHMIPLLDADIRKVARSGATIIWSPRSNLSLYGLTSNLTALKREHVGIAIGSDWTYSGSCDVLEELNLAKRYNDRYLDSAFSNRELWAMATVNPAKLLQLAGKLGDIRPGAYADLMMVRLGNDDAARDLTDEEVYSRIITARRGSISLVARSGKILYGEKEMLRNFSGDWDELTYKGRTYVLFSQRETGRRLAQLAAANSRNYPLFPDLAENETPLDRPVRKTTRTSGATVYDGIPKAGDADGDGIPDDRDSAPKIFNPIRPVDVTSGGSKQPVVR